MEVVKLRSELDRMTMALENVTQLYAGERTRRRLAERRIAELNARLERGTPSEPPPRVLPLTARQAYQDVAAKMRHLKAEPPTGTPAWKRWLDRSPDDEWRQILEYAQGMGGGR